jgi:hypothetical protein
MHRKLAAITSATCAALTVMLVSAAPAMGGEFAVAACQSDKLNNATAAFKDFASRGMLVKRACTAGPGERGLITANVQRVGVVNRGAASVATITAPPGTVITFVRWRGHMDRDDCRFRVDLYAELQGNRYQDLQHVNPSASELATDQCRPRFRPALFAPANATIPKKYVVGNFDAVGARRIVQRVVCQARRFCSTGGKNFVQTLEVDMTISDVQAPAVTITPGTPLADGAWVSGNQPLRYDAQDNVGVREASVITSKGDAGSDDRTCALATSAAFALPAPCPNGVGQIGVKTYESDEGTQHLIVRAQDAAGNPGDSAPVTAKIDNTAPPQVPVSVDGGEQWRNRNEFALSWTNPAEDDRAPIVAATYKLCTTAGGSCTQAERANASIAGLPVQVPGPGEWLASVWRRDEAGNQDAKAASVPVTLRYDPDAPQLGFEPSPLADPTEISVQVTDGLSGLADGSIEISRAGSNTWQALGTQKIGSRLLARIDDAALPAGTYVLRSTARDLAGNEGSTTTRLDGQQMSVTLPLRIASAVQVGVVGKRTVRRVVRVHGKRRTVTRRVTVLEPSAALAFGGKAQVTGRLTNSGGQGIPGAELQVLSRSDASAEQLVDTVRTDGAGNFAYAAAGISSRVLRFAYAGSHLILPTQGEVGLRVPATSTLRPSRTRLTNGESVDFIGRVQTLPVPASGKLVELQVMLSGRFQTFRSTHTDQAGAWRLSYRFARTRTLQRFRFRVKLPREAGYPFGVGVSRSVQVLVRGR